MTERLMGPLPFGTLLAALSSFCKPQRVWRHTRRGLLTLTFSSVLQLEADAESDSKSVFVSESSWE